MRLAAKGKAECLPSRDPFPQADAVATAFVAFPLTKGWSEGGTCLPSKDPFPQADGVATGFVAFPLTEGRGEGGSGIWREGILPSLAPSGAPAIDWRRMRLSAFGKAECLSCKGSFALDPVATKAVG